MLRVSVLGLLCCGVLFGSGCGDDSGDDMHDDGGDHVGDHADGHLKEVPCTAEHPAYQAGLTSPAGDLTVRLLSATPAPPRQQMQNDWIIEIVDAAGAPVTGATIEDAKTYMEVHDHDGPRPPLVEAQAEPGRFKLDGLTFNMRGPWEVRFGLEAPDRGNVPVRFKICVE